MLIIRIGDFDFRLLKNKNGESIFIQKNCGDNEGEGMEISFSRFNRIFEDLFEEEM